MEKSQTVHDRVKEREVGNVEEAWKHMKESRMMNAEKVCDKRYADGGSL